MLPTMRVNSAYNMLLVFPDEKKSVDSNAMMPVQAAAGHQARRRLGRDAVRSGVKSASSLLRRVVRRFARDHDIVDVALTQAGGADAHEACLLLEFGNGLASA